MKSFTLKFAICLLPCIVAAIICALIPPKFGTDLSGGTNLVYEIDLSRTRDSKDNIGAFDPIRDTNILAEALKRRIDPNDLYNITIRPAGGEGRVEIILPTGGTQTAEKAERAWKALLADLEKTRFDGQTRLNDVPRGKIFELADKIQILESTEKWENKLFRDPDSKTKLGEEAWKNLKNEAVERWAGLEPVRKEMVELDKAPLRLDALKKFIVTKLSANPDEATTDKVVDTWIKQQAWGELLNRIEQNWKTLGLNEYKAEMKQIEPDSFEQLIGFVQSKGVLGAQAGLSVIEPLVGNDIPFTDDTPARKEIDDFIKDHYGESAASILKEIEKQNKSEGRSRDLSLEEVQRIKDLVAKVGSLEFRILANSEDDKEGIKAARAIINTENPAVQDQIKKAQEIGIAPPAPDEQFTINLPNNQKSIVKYEWVELGPQERKSLHLDNASKNDPDPRISHPWKEAFFKSKSERAFHISDMPGSVKNIIQGALFYRRECKNRNLPEEERRKKDVEYFVLTRTPEYDPTDPTKQTPKIGGDYLISASSDLNDGITPSASFTFNSAGGALFGTITRKNVPSGSGGEESQIHRHLAIILDDQVMSAPRINSIITTRGQISGNFTRKEVDSLVNILRAGRLPATLKPQPVSETTMGATLGEDTIKSGVFAVILSFMAVLAFMCIYYKLAGVIASIALLANLLLTVGFMVGVQATFTLPGLAGLVLMLGMAVDANVLIYERLREERERGAALPLALRNAYSRALPTIIDTHLSSIFTAIVLYVVGNDQLKGFGVSLTAGLVISLFTSLYMTHVIFDYLMSKRIFTEFKPLQLFARPNFDFMSIRHVMFALTLVFAILGMVLFIYRLPDDLNIDFIGGTAYSGQLTEAVKIEKLRKYFDEDHQKKLLDPDFTVVEEVSGSTGLRFLVKYKDEDKGRVISLANKSDVADVKIRVTKFPDVSIEQSFPSSTDYTKFADPTSTPHFTIRTSERETEIVQTVLDRLLREGNSALLKKVYLQYDPLTARETRLRFFDDPERINKDVALPGFVKGIFTRELMEQFGVKDKKDLPISFELFGDSGVAPDGRYSVIRIRFENDLKPAQKAHVEAALTKLVSAFEARPQPERLENFDSQLANETRYRAMWAVLASWVAIAVYLWFRFGNWTFGLAAVVCLIHDLFLTLGVIAACHYAHGTTFGNLFALDDFKIDLPAVAALLTLVGYSVNDTIVVFDRIREVRGKNPDLTAKMINDSVNQTLSRTVLASLTTWLVVFVLYVWGGPGVHLFAFVMVIGVVIGTYSSIYIASPLLLMLGEGVKDAGPGKTLPKKLQTAIKPA